MNEYSVVLVSNSRPENTSSTFTTHLPDSLVLNDGTYGVGLQDIIFARSWDNKTLRNSSFTIHYHDGKTLKVPIENPDPSNAASFVEALNGPAVKSHTRKKRAADGEAGTTKTLTDEERQALLAEMSVPARPGEDQEQLDLAARLLAGMRETTASGDAPENTQTAPEGETGTLPETPSATPESEPTEGDPQSEATPKSPTGEPDSEENEEEKATSPMEVDEPPASPDEPIAVDENESIEQIQARLRAVEENLAAERIEYAKVQRQIREKAFLLSEEEQARMADGEADLHGEEIRSLIDHRKSVLEEQQRLERERDALEEQKRKAIEDTRAALKIEQEEERRKLEEANEEEKQRIQEANDSALNRAIQDELTRFENESTKALTEIRDRLTAEKAALEKANEEEKQRMLEANKDATVQAVQAELKKAEEARLKSLDELRAQLNAEREAKLKSALAELGDENVTERERLIAASLKDMEAKFEAELAWRTSERYKHEENVRRVDAERAAMEEKKRAEREEKYEKMMKAASAIYNENQAARLANALLAHKRRKLEKLENEKALEYWKRITQKKPAKIGAVGRKSETPPEENDYVPLIDYDREPVRSDVTFSLVDGRVRIDFVPEIVKKVELTKGLAYTAGFSKETIFAPTAAKYSIDPYASIHAIFLYSDICEPTYVGNTKTNLLAVIPIEDTMKTVVHKSFSPIRYIPVSAPIVSSIRCELCDSLGQPIAFQYGNTIATLSFKRFL